MAPTKGADGRAGRKGRTPSATRDSAITIGRGQKADTTHPAFYYAPQGGWRDIVVRANKLDPFTLLPGRLQVGALPQGDGVMITRVM